MIGALLLKDLMIARYRALIGPALVLLMFLVSGRVGGLSAFSLHFSVWIVMSQAMATEDKGRGDVLINVLPVSRRQIVQGRYLSLGTYVSALALLSCLVITALAPLAGKAVAVAALEKFVAAGVLLTTVFWSLALPLILKYGMTRAHFAVSLFMLLPMFLFGTMRIALREWPDVADALARVAAMSAWVQGGLAACAALLLAYASYRLSVYFYERRDL
jgi:ABC-2 type transport system permease protein